MILALLAVVICGALEWPFYWDLWPKELKKSFGRAQSEQIPVSKLYLVLLRVWEGGKMWLYILHQTKAFTVVFVTLFYPFFCFLAIFSIPSSEGSNSRLFMSQ